MPCPESGTTMKNHLTQKLEEPEIIQEWHDEDGCGLRDGCFLYSKVVSMDETEFLIVVLSRLVNYGQGPMILRNSVQLGGQIQITDLQNRSANFKPLAVIFHIGDVQGQQTYGHFMADVQNLNGKWYRTSDEMMPEEIDEVTDQGYIFLYKKKSISIINSIKKT